MMMTIKMKVQVISKETIKPSSPTPSHLTSFKLSYLDQLSPTLFVPIILFYTNNDDNIECCSREQYCNRLKESLSKCLTSFYPLAGRIKENASEIDCNDAGVDFSETRVINSNLSDVINSNPDSTALNQFLPYSIGTELTCNTPLLAIQVNAFDCGGMVIGMCISHRVADASSISTLLRGWSNSSTTTTATNTTPCFDLASLFPMREYLAGFQPTDDGIMEQKNIVTKRFVFDASSISSIKHKILLATNENSNGWSLAATRVETVSAFIIRRLMDLGRANKRVYHNKPVTALYTVNLRKRRVPPVPEDSFGNMYGNVIMPITSDVMEINDNNNINNIDHKYTSNMIDMASLVGKLRAAIREVDGEYMKKLENNGDWYVNCIIQPLFRSLKEETGPLVGFSSWCRFGFYEIADFGWGKPIWVATGTIPVKNSVVLMDTKSGDGIEAWVNMLEEDMVEFERDQELLAFVSSSGHQIIINI